MKISRKSLFVLAATFAFVPAASAATDTDNLEVTATVANGCVITATSVDFGPYDTQAPANDTASGDILVRCNEGTAAVITLGQGGNADGGSSDAVPARRMAGSVAGFLAYNLYQDVGGTVWGNTPLTGLDYIGAAGGAEETLQVLGEIPALQAAVGGNYSDSVVATITF